MVFGEPWLDWLGWSRGFWVGRMAKGQTVDFKCQMQDVGVYRDTETRGECEARVTWWRCPAQAGAGTTQVTTQV